jgi:hypothetical protein
MCFQVEYQCEGFLEKNKDTVFEEQIKVLKSSKVTMDRHILMRIYSIKCYLDISFLAIIIIFLAKSVLLVVFYLSNI